MKSEEGRYYPEQKSNCKYIIVPSLYLQEEEGEENTFHNMHNCYNAVMRRMFETVDKSKEQYNLKVKVMYCRSVEGEKVGIKDSLVWKLEVAYPISHPSYDGNRPPSDSEALLVARLALPNYPQCHKVF